jgi:hypothetical protein
MGDVVSLKKRQTRKVTPGAAPFKHCVHQWEESPDGEGEPNAAFSVTTYRCRRCGALKTVSRRR